MVPPLSYRTVEEIDAEITALANDFPATCRRFTLTRPTHEGRTMACLKIGTGTETDRPRVLITTGVHGRELVPPDVLLNYIRKLLEAHRDNHAISIPAFTDGIDHVTYPSVELSADDAKRIVNRVDLFVVPLVNPDGRAFEIVLNPLTNPDGTFNTAPGGGGGITWRMNRRPNPGTDSANPLCTGVDLNRNFDIAWRVEDYYANPTDSSVDVKTVPCVSDNYKGPSAGSEPETKNIVDLVITESIQFSLDIHSAAGEIFFPWGIEDTQSDDQFKNFDNPLWNHDPAHPDEHPGRDGVGHSGYGEFFPDSSPIRLRTQHRIIANTMRDEVLVAAGSNETARSKSTLKTGHSAEITNEVFPGTMMDWIFSRQFLGSGGPEPIFSFGMEVIPPPEPSGAEMAQYSIFRPDPVKAFRKTEREVFVAVHAFLKYLAAWWPPRTGSSTCNCFIATATFGSEHHPHVEFLRDLRDRIFPSTPLGKRFIHVLTQVYYSFSPEVARYLNRHEFARRFARYAFLVPLVAALRGSLGLSKEQKYQVPILMGTLLSMALMLVAAAAELLAFLFESLVR